MLKRQKRNWKAKVASSMAKKPNIQVRPSNTEIARAFWNKNNHAGNYFVSKKKQTKTKPFKIITK